VTTDLIDQARAGEQDAFARLVAPHRRELHVYCYRILGSTQDAEDALQDTLVAAWQGLAGYEGPCFVAHVALPRRHQPVSEHAAFGQTAPAFRRARS
jgi:hypothetical protein